MTRVAVRASALRASWGVLCVVAGVSMLASRQASAKASRCSYADIPGEVEPFDHGTIVGGIVRIVPPPEAVVGSLANEARRAEDILVGSVVGCRAVRTGSLIDTIYELSPERVLKGTPAADRITVEYLGGRLDQIDRAAIETRLQAFRPPEIGDRLLVFLRPHVKTTSGEPSATYQLRFGLWSSFLLAPDGTVQPSYHIASEGKNVATTTRGRKIDDVVEEVVAAIKSGGQ